MYNMLEYALSHCGAVNSMTQDYILELRKFELDDKEWDLLGQLHNVLRVCVQCLGGSVTNMTVTIDPHRCHTVFLILHPQSCNRHSSDGSHQ